jgi:hypothetical protein
LALRSCAVNGIPTLVNRFGRRPWWFNEGDEQAAMVAAVSSLTFDEDRA